MTNQLMPEMNPAEVIWCHMRRRSMEIPIQSCSVNNRKPRWNTLFQMFQWFQWILQEPWAIILPYGQPGACSVNRMGAECSMCLPFHQSTIHYLHFTPEITWHPKKIAARLISLVLPGMCYASFRENIHYLNSNSGYCEHYWRSQRTRFRKKKLLECMDTYSFLKWRNNKIKEFSEHRSFLSHVNHQDQKPWFPHSCFL